MTTIRNKFLLFKTRDEALRVRLSDIAYFTADRNYTKLHLIHGQCFIFATNLGVMEQSLKKQLEGNTPIFIRIGKSHIINKLYILHINIPKQKLKLGPFGSSTVDIHVSKEALRNLKELMEKKYSPGKQ